MASARLEPAFLHQLSQLILPAQEPAQGCDPLVTVPLEQHVSCPLVKVEAPVRAVGAGAHHLLVDEQARARLCHMICAATASARWMWADLGPMQALVGLTGGVTADRVMNKAGLSSVQSGELHASQQ